MIGQLESEGPVKGLTTWLDAMAARPVPGGVSAAAVAAAMGAALIAKAARVGGQRGVLEPSCRAMFSSVEKAARAQSRELLRLAGADAAAYQAVLASPTLPTHDSARRQAWAEATEVPVRIAEVCTDVQDRLSSVSDLCPAVIQDDLQIGDWLLEVGRRAGLLAAESDLPSVQEPSLTGALRTRLDALKEKTV